MEDERCEPGMPALDRQAAPYPAPGPAAGRPRSVPETAPTPLQRQYVHLSVIALIVGAIAITAVEAGAPLSSPLIKLCVLVAAPILVVTTADAALRIWRSAWAWMPVDRGRGLFRLTWLLAAATFVLAVVAAGIVVLAA